MPFTTFQTTGGIKGNHSETTGLHRYQEPTTINLPTTDLIISSVGFLPTSGQELELMSRRKQRSAFDQVSEFDRGRIVAYRDCGLSFREIGSRGG
ncbi:hypothetical protein TNCV_1610101 [Trichonephila clavipes]|nr:hypothetical protein TNCV_1610101 [Trichonephila clavipes]